MFKVTKDVFAQAIQNSDPVEGLTHKFYRYPARFSPVFARTAIKLFTKPGDIVLDPFMGGGTTLIEARALGRKAIGVDINSLAVFLAIVKTTSYSSSDLTELTSWADSLINNLSLSKQTRGTNHWNEKGYLRNINQKPLWRIRKLISLALQTLRPLSKKQKLFARCLLLKTAQWAFDCRKDIPTIDLFRKKLSENLTEMIDGATSFQLSIKNTPNPTKQKSPLKPIFLHRSSIGLELDKTINNMPSPKLILTSPPYPGVHVLYHRWQVQGRRESPAPYWIANCLDGNGPSFYTLGDRKNDKSYFDQIFKAFSSIAKISNEKTKVVQLIAFSEPSYQLPKYLEAMESSGFKEIIYPSISNKRDGRLWRKVPNRKWYTDSKNNPSSKEVVLIHKLS